LEASPATFQSVIFSRIEVDHLKRCFQWLLSYIIDPAAFADMISSENDSDEHHSGHHYYPTKSRVGPIFYSKFHALPRGRAFLFWLEMR